MRLGQNTMMKGQRAYHGSIKRHGQVPTTAGETDKNESLPPAQDFRNCVADDRPRLLDLFSRQADRHTDLQSRLHHLLRLEVVLESLEAADKDAVGKTLVAPKVSIVLRRKDIDRQHLPRQRYPAARIVDHPRKASSRGPPRA